MRLILAFSDIVFVLADLRLIQTAAFESAETTLHRFSKSYRFLPGLAPDLVTTGFSHLVTARSSFSRSRTKFWILYVRIPFDRLSAT
jgi:hypothetical protein